MRKFVVAALLAAGSSVASAETFIVNEAGDQSDASAADGVCAATANGTDCTLRAAIQQANAAPDFDRIEFAANISQVSLGSSLPTVVGRVWLDGSRADAANPRIVINGANGTHKCLEFNSPSGNDIPADAEFQAHNSRVENLVVQRCDGAGISIVGHGYLVRNNYVGLNAEGTAAEANDNDGILISASLDQGAVPADFPAVNGPPPIALRTVSEIQTYLQGVLPATLPPSAVVGNVVSGNTYVGIRLESQYVTGTIVHSNTVGLGADKLTVIPNGTAGGANAHGIAITGPVYLNFITENTVAGQSANANSHGIAVNSASAFPLPNVISYNDVGFSALDPTLDLGNSLSGIMVNFSNFTNNNPMGASTIVGPENRVGWNRGAGAPIESVNSGNGGLFLAGAGPASSGVQVFGNQVGIALVGAAWYEMPNASHGINVSGRDHLIAHNVVGSNGGHGISIRGGSLDFGHVVQGNRVGLDMDGQPHSNLGSGIRVFSGGHLIGGAPVDGNIIANNLRHGIQLSTANAWSVKIAGNSIYDVPLSFLGVDLDYPSEAADPTSANDAVVDRSNAAKNYTNWQQNAVVLSNPVYSSAQQSLALSYSLASAPAGTYLLEVFANDEDGQVGQRTLGTFNIATGPADASGWGGVSGTITVPVSIDLAGKYVTALVTDTQSTAVPLPPGQAAAAPANNTSEFSNAVLVGGGPAQPTGSIQIGAVTYAVTEGTPVVIVTLQRVGGSAGAVSVTIASAPGTATAGQDFADLTQVVQWADGDVADKTVQITIQDDQMQETDEQFAIGLSAPQGATLGSPTQATVTIADNDGIFTPIAKLETIPTNSPFALAAAALLLMLAGLACVVRTKDHL